MGTEHRINRKSQKIFALASFIFGLVFLLAGLGRADLHAIASTHIACGFFGSTIGIVLSLTNALDIPENANE